VPQPRHFDSNDAIAEASSPLDVPILDGDVVLLDLLSAAGKVFQTIYSRILAMAGAR